MTLHHAACPASKSEQMGAAIFKATIFTILPVQAKRQFSSVSNEARFSYLR